LGIRFPVFSRVEAENMEGVDHFFYFSSKRAQRGCAATKNFILDTDEHR
jgi:hypothetical protein